MSAQEAASFWDFSLPWQMLMVLSVIAGLVGLWLSVRRAPAEPSLLDMLLVPLKAALASWAGSMAVFIPGYFLLRLFGWA